MPACAPASVSCEKEAWITVYLYSILLFRFPCLAHPDPMAISPQDIHPALWRGTQLGARTGPTVSTGHAALDAELPGAGWPVGALTELLVRAHGIGEVRLLQPALASACPDRPVVLLHPPFRPNALCWSGWDLPAQRLLCIDTGRARDTWWAAEQVLRHNCCAALILWADPIRVPELRRLHMAAQSGEALFFMFRPLATREQASPAALRLALAPQARGVRVSILKRRGPACAHAIDVALPDSGLLPDPSHVLVDRPVPAPPQPGRLAPAVAH